MTEVEQTRSENHVADDSVLYDEPEDLNTQSVIQNRYCFWYHKRGGKVQQINYEESMKQLASFQTIQQFWRVYNHMIRPGDIKSTTDYHLFKDGIKPTWEDPQNKNGGKWMIRLRKGLASMLWEEIVLSIIGEQFDVGHEICGAVVSVRNSEDIISVWNKTADNLEATNKIRDHMRRVMKLPSYVQLEYKKHVDSLADKSSFRNPTLVWKPKENHERGGGGGARYHKEGGDRGTGGERGERGDRGGERSERGGGDREHHRDSGRHKSGDSHHYKDKERGGGDKDKDDDGHRHSTSGDKSGGQNTSGNTDKSSQNAGRERSSAWKTGTSGGSSNTGGAWSSRDNTGSSNTGDHSGGTSGGTRSSGRTGGGGGEGSSAWSRTEHKKRDDTTGSTTAAASAVDWINKRPSGGSKTEKSTSAADTDNVWVRRGSSGTSTQQTNKSD